MRVFIAVDLPDDAKAALLKAQKQLSTAAAKMSLVHDFHLTLKFLGEITPAKVEAVKVCLGGVRFRPFAAVISGIGVFPNESYIRVVWAGIEPESEAVQLQSFIDKALEKEFSKEKGFRPHLTLARVKLVSDKERFVRQLRQVKIEGGEFAVNNFRLKRSMMSPAGAVYNDLAVYRL